MIGLGLSSRKASFLGLPDQEVIEQLLLEDYSGAAAAYSLRKISGAYSGSAIRVRRDSDSSETDIGFDGDGNLDTTALATFCGNINGTVAVWYDQSGNGNDATQTTPSSQPKIYDSSTGVVTENGKPALQMSSNTVNLSVPNSKSTFKFLHDGSSSSNLWVVSPTDVRQASGTVVHELLETGAFSGSVGLEVTYTSGQYSSTELGRFTVKNGTSNSVDYSTPSNTFAVGQNLVSFYIDADNAVAADRLKVGTNGQTLLTGNTSTNAPSISDSQLDFTIYGGFTAHWQEVIVWDSDKSSDRTGIETNANDYYTVWQTYNFDLTPNDLQISPLVTEWDLVIGGSLTRGASATDAQKHTADLAANGRNTANAYQRLNLKAAVELVDTNTQTTYTATGYLYTSAPESAGIIYTRLSGQDASSVLSASDLKLLSTDFTPNLPDLTPAGQLTTGWEGRVTLEADPASPVVINGSTYNASSNNDWASQPSGAYQSILIANS